MSLILELYIYNVKKNGLAILFCFVSLSQLRGQVIYRESELGLGIGVAQYYGDLNQSQRLNYIRPGVSIFYKYNFNSYIALKGNVSGNRVGASDALSNNIFQKSRNLSFESNVFSISANSEFNFFDYSLGDFDRRFTPYMNLGLGIMHYDPYAFFGKDKYFLKPLGTEGQNLPEFSDRKYSNLAMILPVGLGFKVWMIKGLTMSGEMTYHFTNTDYLDDVSTTYIGVENFPVIDPPPPYPLPAAQLQDRSVELGIPPIGVAGRQRGISGNKDQFLTAQIGFSYRLRDRRCPK
jgi:hypothetical protein